MVEILGSIPPSLLMKGRRTAELLDEQGKFLRIPKLGLASLERVLNGDTMPLMKPPDMPDDEIDVFIDFVRGMLQIDPMARKSRGKLIRGPRYKRSSLECMLNGKVSPHNKPSGMSEKEFAIFVDFLKGMLENDPTKRKSAAQLLQHEWLS
ncbi:hypothetical protein E4U09_006657 [Claviceps aff. purpurea]|uniref:non-specific serine/threonine protein kinase n=1 Tax=Claviceps aff. purpurea TaxID=1967640 RepID=A0A9P7U128_9HYPO|nr:hypothetical protein E4U09_006657 [Claviceps aff. purpurea]